jgi:hypothetical protein
MREFCLTEEVIQRFVDGELSKEQMEEAAAHLSSCSACANLLDAVEQENSVLMEAFAPELSLPVPTAALRVRLDEAIAELTPARGTVTESTGSRVRAWFGFLFGSFSFTPQRGLAFASLAVVVIFAAIFAVIQLRSARNAQPTSAGISNPSTIAPAPASVEPPQTPPQVADVTPTPEVTPEVNTVKRAKTNRRALPQFRNTIAKNNQPKITPAPNQPAPVETKLLPGEKGYLEAIASLTTAIEANKDDVLKPTVRADYERNLAVVDQAIASTRQQAKRNPNDRDAAEFMYMAYQNKIDLLSAVADQTRIAAR